MLARCEALKGLKAPDPETVSDIRERYVLPILTNLAIDSIEACVLEARIAYKSINPDWNGTDPIPCVFAADGRWPKPYGHNALDGSVYAYLILFAADGSPVPLTRRFCFAGTYHRESPGGKKRVIQEEEKVQCNLQMCGTVGVIVHQRRRLGVY